MSGKGDAKASGLASGLPLDTHWRGQQAECQNEAVQSLQFCLCAAGCLTTGAGAGERAGAEDRENERFMNSEHGGGNRTGDAGDDQREMGADEGASAEHGTSAENGPNAESETAPVDGDLYRLVVENLQDHAVAILDTSRHVLTWNRGAERLFGFTAEEMHGRSADRIFTAEDLAAGRPTTEAQEALATGQAEDNRWHVRKDGSRFWGSGAMIRLDDGRGAVRGLAKIIRDQTALKLAEQEREQVEAALRSSELRFRRLIEANIIGVGIASAAGVWIDANDELLRILQQTRDELRRGEIRWDQITPQEYQPLDKQGIAEANARGACTPYEKELVLPNQRRVPILTGYAPVSGIEGHYVCFVLDLTPQKQVEQALREAGRRKDEFLAMLAHELRNPLAPIRSGLDLLAMTGSDMAVVEPMQQQVEHLVRLVDDLLDVSRIMRGKVELRKEPVELSTIVARAVETARPVIETQKHAFVQELPPDAVLLDADPVRLAQVLANLLTNAAKYTEEGGHIWLTAGRHRDEVWIEVRDTGIGIEPELVSGMFDLFAQARQTIDRSQGGLGIGLTVVKSLVEMHGGRVAASSEGLGRGCRFTVHLPARSEPVLSAGAPELNDSLPDYRILVVDDNRAAAKMLALLLAKLGGHEVITAHDGSEALEAAREHRPDLILLDIGLPKLSGYEVARRLRQQPETAQTLLAAVTGYGAAEDRHKSLQAGCDAHLVKPPSLAALKKLLAHPKLKNRS